MNYFDFPYDLSYVSTIAGNGNIVLVKKKDHYFSLGIGLSTRCNFNCPICYYNNARKHTPRDLSLTLLSDILYDMPILSSIIIGLEGEPFCYQNFFEALDIMRDKTDTFNIVSNGSLLNKTTCASLKNYPISSFILSLNAGDEYEYSKFHPGGNFRIFKKHTEYLLKYIENNVYIHSVIFKENISSILLIPKVASEIGINKINFQQLRQSNYSIKNRITIPSENDLNFFITNIIDNAIKYNVDIYFDNFFGSTQLMDTLYILSKNIANIKINPPSESSCTKIFKFTSITSSGYIFPCCGDFNPEIIGSFSFDGIFNHKYLQYLRYIHKNNIAIPPCLSCMNINLPKEKF